MQGPPPARTTGSDHTPCGVPHEFALPRRAVSAQRTTVRLEPPPNRFCVGATVASVLQTRGTRKAKTQVDYFRLVREANSSPFQDATAARRGFFRRGSFGIANRNPARPRRVLARQARHQFYKSKPRVNDYHAFSCGLDRNDRPGTKFCGVSDHLGAACRALSFLVFEIVKFEPVHHRVPPWCGLTICGAQKKPR
jgi:hypothetical protein